MDRRGSSSSKPAALAIDATRAETEARGGGSEAVAGDREEPMSPCGRLFREPRLSCYIVAVLGLGAPVDLAAARAGLEATLARHPRFCSVQAVDESEKGATPRWVRTTVNLDNHLIVSDLAAAATAADPDRALEDYLASLSTLPMDNSRPLWELHVLDFPTADATTAFVLRLHHSLGDGVSLLSLPLACTGRPADTAALPALQPAAPSARRHAGPVYALPPRPAPSSSRTAATWVMSVLVLAWHTVVDVAGFVATMASILSDPPTLFKGAEGVELRPERFVNRTLSLDDVKHVKSVMNCTVNDVLLGVTSAALSRYYFRKTDGRDVNNITVRFGLVVNLRKTRGLHTLGSMMESGKDNGVRWGNQLGYMLLPFHIAKHDDLLDHIRTATQVARRKKNSMASLFTYWSAAMAMKILGIKAAACMLYGVLRNTTLVFSNMIGPSEQMVFCGHPVVYIAPSIYGIPSALTVHYMSYMNIIKLVISVDDAQFPDSHELLDDFAESLRLIKEAASRKAQDTQI